MKIYWDKYGYLNIETRGCYDCSGEHEQLSIEEVHELLSKRPVIKENENGN